MNRLILASVLVGCCLAMPRRQSGGPIDNHNVKILELESYQNGANYGHSLQQEDGTASGQKVGPDGLVYGFYSYIQDDGTRLKVYYRAGKGVGYEVLKTEGIDAKGLGNLKAHTSATPQAQQPRQHQPQPRQHQPQPRQHQPQPRQHQPQPVQQTQLHQTISQTLPVQPPRSAHQPRHRPAVQPTRSASQPRHRPAVQPVVHRQPAPVQHQQPQFVPRHQAPLPQINPLVSSEPTPAPHRFDYPANLSLQRTGTGFRSSFKAV